jgi:hypothetical protein
MSRILTDLPDDDIAWLDRKAAAEGKSRAALVREAVGAYRAERAGSGMARYFGIWKNREDIEDGLDYQRRMRGEWDRDEDSGGA